ncbi:TatD family [Cunninghamella echinulata]|nr:TatD family [Cunninghamella echinulata]
MCQNDNEKNIDPIHDDPLVNEFKEEWYGYLCDAHCHVHDDKERHKDIPLLQTGHITLMGVRQDDWNIVENITQLTNSKDNNKCIPCFGIHPWYTYRVMTEEQQYKAINDSNEQHQEEQQQSSATTTDTTLFYEAILEGPDKKEKQELISFLPAPIPYTEWYQQLEALLQRYPKAIVGEVGLDRSARILPKGAIEWHGVKPTSVVCHIDHQYNVLQLQLKLAIQYQRSVSLHCVQSQGHVLKLCQWANQYIKQHYDIKKKEKEAKERKKVKKLNICLHSFGGKPASIQQFLHFTHLDIYVSFSTAINARLGWHKLSQLIQSVPDHLLLIESDFNTPKDLDHAMVRIACLVARAKQWSLHDTLLTTNKNWSQFTGVSLE